MEEDQINVLWLRDQFACAALTGMLAHEYTRFPAHQWAMMAYEYADAMLYARSSKKETP